MPVELAGERRSASQPSHEWLCRQIVERSGYSMLFADREGVIRFWNRRAEDMFGYAASEAVGLPLDIIIPERWRERHAHGYRQAMATGSTRYARNVLAVPAVRKDGARLSIEFTIVLVRDCDDTVVGAAAVIQDVTERWQREKAMNARIVLLEAELERVKRAPGLASGPRLGQPSWRSESDDPVREGANDGE
jgi:PAS domain S-box-containing protein